MTDKSQHILFILDRSGSMATQTSDVIGGFNQFIKELKLQAEIDGLNTLVSLVTFANDHKVVYGSRPIQEVKPMTAKSYRPSGGTALLDAVHDTVTKYLETLGQGEFATQKTEADPVLTIIFTDGEENSSRIASFEMVQKLIAKCEELGNWSFTYAGAHANAWEQSQRMGVRYKDTVDAKDMTFGETSQRLYTRALDHRMRYQAEPSKPARTKNPKS